MPFMATVCPSLQGTSCVSRPNGNGRRLGYSGFSYLRKSSVQAKSRFKRTIHHAVSSDHMACMPARVPLLSRRKLPSVRQPVSRRDQSMLQSSVTDAALKTALQHSSSLWRLWTALICVAALAFHSERYRFGRELSGPLVATILGLILSNTGVIPPSSSQYNVVNKFFLPLAVPLLLFTADLRQMFRETGRLLAIFCIGSVGTIVGTLAAASVLPLTALGADAWKVAAALCARHIGGAVNFVAVADATAMSPSAQSAALAADNLVCIVYFTTLFHLARSIPADSEIPSEGRPVDLDTQSSDIKVMEGCVALAFSAAVCYVAAEIQVAFQMSGFLIPIATAITVAVATCAPQLLAPLKSSAEGIASLFMMLFFACIGANSSVGSVVKTAPMLFIFCIVQIGVHLGIILGAGKLLGFSRRDVLVASNANVGGPATAAGMCAAKGWRSILTPALLVGTFGYATATFVCMALGKLILVKIM